MTIATRLRVQHVISSKSLVSMSKVKRLLLSFIIEIDRFIKESKGSKEVA